MCWKCCCRKRIWAQAYRSCPTAYHEAGHALVAELIKEVDPVHKVTIIPRGQALGLTQLLPEEDRHSYNRARGIIVTLCTRRTSLWIQGWTCW